MATPQQIVGDDWQEIPVGRMTGGLNLADQPELIDPTFFTRYENVIPFQGKVQVDTGIDAYLGPVRGNPRKKFQHVTRAGVSHKLLITNTTVYREASAQWQLISNGTTTTTSSNFAAAGTTVNFTSVVGFAIGSVVAIIRGDGTQYQGAITNIAGSTVTLDPANGGAQINSGATVIEAIALNGDDDNHVVALTVPWSDECVFTNGVDSPQVYNPSTVTIATLTGLPSGGDTQCKSIALFDNSLFLINTSEGGQDFPQRYRWSDRADITEWATGESGSNDLLAESHALMHGLPLGPYLFIYRTRSIYRVQAVNSATKRFNAERTIANDGITSIGGVADLGDRHIFTGLANFYEYRGGFDKVPIGDAVSEAFFGNLSPADQSKIHKLFMLHISERREVLVFFQMINDTNPRNCFRYSDKYKSWGTRTFSREFTGYGYATTTAEIVTWANAVGTWANYIGKWNSSSLSGADESLFLLSSTNDQVYEYNFAASTDDGVDIVGTIETKDFAVPGWISRLDYLEVKASGLEISVYWSADQGTTWTLLQINDPGEGTVQDFISPGTVSQTVRISHSQAFPRIRFRFESANAFSIEWFKLRLIPDYEW